MAVVICEGLYKTYDGAEKPVLNGISLSLEEGCFVSIMGRSGSGKSTLLKTMCGLITPDRGSVEVCGYNVHKLSGREQSRFRSEVIGIVFQESNLVSDFNVTDNILAPLYIAGKRADKAHFDRLIELTELGEHLHKLPSQLSGGQRQRVAVARAVIARPQIVFADEPTGSLDRLSEQNMMQLLKSMNREFSTAIVQVTHSTACADAGERVIRIDDGKVVVA